MVKDFKSKDVKKNSKELYTLDNKHRNMVKILSNNKIQIDTIKLEIEKINSSINDINKSDYNSDHVKQKAVLLAKKDSGNEQITKLINKYEEMEYYDNGGDLITN